MCCVGGLLSLRVKLHIGHLLAGNNPSDSLTDFFIVQRTRIHNEQEV